MGRGEMRKQTRTESEGLASTHISYARKHTSRHATAAGQHRAAGALTESTSGETSKEKGGERVGSRM